VAAARFAADGSCRAPLLAALVAVMALQIGIHGLHTLNFFRYLATGADREAYLTRNVNAYAAVPWINANLKPTDVVFIEHRELRYYLSVPSFFGTAIQAVVDLRPETTDLGKLHRQLRRAGITHLLLSAQESPGVRRYGPPLQLLRDGGCVVLVRDFEIRSYQSRTLPTLESHLQILDLVKLRDESCLP